MRGQEWLENVVNVREKVEMQQREVRVKLHELPMIFHTVQLCCMVAVNVLWHVLLLFGVLDAHYTSSTFVDCRGHTCVVLILVDVHRLVPFMEVC